MQEGGVVEIRATNRELLEGSAFVSVRPQQPTTGTTFSLPKLIERTYESRPYSVSSRPRRRLSGYAPLQFVLTPSRKDAPPAGTKVASSSRPRIRVFYAPHRTLLADGKDAASIVAFLVGERRAVETDVLIRLIATDGKLVPTDLVIPKGSDRGEIRLTSAHEGPVDLEFVQGDYDLDLGDQPKVTVPFGPPITGLTLTYPSEISLVDSASILVELVGDQGIPLKTNVPRHVSAALAAGRAELGDVEADIAAGSTSTRLKLVPTGLQDIRLVIKSDQLKDTEAAVRVRIPTLLLMLTICGGAIGGWVAATQMKTGLATRMIVGVIVAFVFYWGVLFMQLQKLPKSVALNPATAVAVAILGGYGGTALLNFLLKQIAPGSGTPATP